MSLTMVIPEFAFAAGQGDSAAGESANREFSLTDSYGPVSLTDAYTQGAIKLPESMQPETDSYGATVEKVTFSEPKFGTGLLLTGKAGDLKSGRIGLDTQFDFNGNPVGRVTVDGLRERGVSVTIYIFLDDQEEPVASFALKNTMGKQDWKNPGDITQDVYGLGITGLHRVSLGFEISGIKDSKETNILLRSLEFAESSLPVMYFNIDENLGSIAAMNSSGDHSAECYGSVDLQVPDGFTGDYDGGAQGSLKNLQLEYIRGRGNSTWTEDKKPYKVKLKDKTNLFGMGANKHWILLANRFDNSLIRNRMTYWLGDQMGLEYTPQCVPVEVVMNGEYYGSYLLCEQIRIGKGRVAIDDLEDDDNAAHATELPFISGGYLLSMEPYGDENTANIFQTNQGVNMFIESPAFEKYDNDTQRQYIIGFVQATENAIFGPGFRDGETPYTDLLDIDAAAKYWWIQEFSANGDAYGSGSTFLYKKRDKGEKTEKLYWGPLWDFDYVAWGDLDYNVNPPETLDCTSTPWFGRMKTDPAFNEKQKAYWFGEDGLPGLNGLITDIVKEGGLLDQYYDQTKVSWKYDREKWGSYDEGGYYGGYYSYGQAESEQEREGRTYQEEVDQLRNWIIGRQQNVSKNIDKLTPQTRTVSFVVGGKVIDTKQVTEGYTIEEFPKAPVKKGYLFDGWKSEKGEIITGYSEIYEDMVLTASYVKESQTVKAKKLYFSYYNVYRELYWSDDEYGSMEYGTYTPDYTIMPLDSNETNVVWSTSNASVATVDEDGTVFFKKGGTVKITGKVGNISNSYTLHIHGPGMPALNWRNTLSLDRKTLKLSAGSYAQIRADFGPHPCEEGYLSWVSADESIAEVDSRGVVTGVSPGTTLIIALDTYEDLCKYCKVIVTGLAAPKLKLTANYSGNKIKAAWKKVKGAKSYKVAYRKAGAKKWKILKTKKTAVTISKIKKGTMYQFRTQAVGTRTASKWSAVKSQYFKKVSAKARAGKKQVTVRWKKDQKASGYQIRYSYNADLSKAKTIKVKKSAVKRTIRKLKKGKKVYVQIRPFRKSNGRIYYGIYSNKQAVRVK